MDSNNKLKEIDIRNSTCYYLDDTININDLHFDNLLIDQKSFEGILIYDIAYKNPYGVKPLCIYIK